MLEKRGQLSESVFDIIPLTGVVIRFMEVLGAVFRSAPNTSINNLIFILLSIYCPV